VVASAAVVAITAPPTTSAEPVANCTSDVIDGVEVDYCVGNPNANTVTDVPGVNVDFEFNFGIGFGGFWGAEPGAGLFMSPGRSSRKHSAIARTVRK
jgi:hypothetical protein